MTGSRSLTFSSARRAPRRWTRVLGVLAAVVLAVLVGWAVVVGLVWGYSWVSLDGVEVAALDPDRAALGASGAIAPPGADTMLLALTGPTDPTEPRPPELVAPVVLLQVGGPRDTPAALVLPDDLEVSVDGSGQRTLAQLQREGGTDALVQATVDYTEVRVDHVVSATVDALPRLADALGGIEVCDPGCSQLTGEEIRARLVDLDEDSVVDRVLPVVRAVAGRIDTRTVLTSPLATRRVVAALSSEVTTDVALRGTRGLAFADTLAGPIDLDVERLPLVTNPATGEVVPLEEPAAVRFQHLREGTPFSGEGTDELVQDLRSDVEVAVANGAGVDGLAGEVRVRLEAAGFVVVATGNAPSFDRDETVVSYLEDDPTTAFVAAELAAMLSDARLEPLTAVPTFEGEPVDVLVTAGSDLDDEGA